MAIQIKPLVPGGLASCYSIFSIFGILFFVFIGLAFDNGADVLLDSEESPPDGHAVAKTCYGAAVVYAVLMGFCACQYLHLAGNIDRCNRFCLLGGLCYKWPYSLSSPAIPSGLIITAQPVASYHLYLALGNSSMLLSRHPSEWQDGHIFEDVMEQRS
ncbi:hypothetical protein BT69DRAFT_1358657 [Atractiella rhizophila]|nr:hypothetical protein BT69DRAFT_1358657 [Atractiella rhizophila]